MRAASTASSAAACRTVAGYVQLYLQPHPVKTYDRVIQYVSGEKHAIELDCAVRKHVCLGEIRRRRRSIHPDLDEIHIHMPGCIIFALFDELFQAVIVHAAELGTAPDQVGCDMQG